MCLYLLLTPLQDIINAMQKGTTFKVRTPIEAMGLWPQQDDLQRMRMAAKFRVMVECGLLSNVRLVTRKKTRHAVYEVV